MNKTERMREKRHSEYRHLEAELRNTLSGVNHLVEQVHQAVKVRDCKTARLNFDQAAISFKAIGRRLVKAAQLHRLLHLSPAAIDGGAAGSVDVRTAPAPPARRGRPPKQAPAKKPAKKGKRK